MNENEAGKQKEVQWDTRGSGHFLFPAAFKKTPMEGGDRLVGIPGRGNRKGEGNEAGVYMCSAHCVTFSPNDQPATH